MKNNPYQTISTKKISPLFGVFTNNYSNPFLAAGENFVQQRSVSKTISGLKGWLTFITCFVLGFGSLDAQSITWAFVNAVGFVDDPDASLRWTIGEPLSLETSDETASLRVGFMPFAYVEDITSATMTINPDIEISIAPNPAAEEIHVQVPGEKHYIIRILSMDGLSRLASDITSEMTIDIQSLPAGTYVLYVMDPNGTYNSKSFIKS